ncbi:MAG: prephenate/arogenate dehydrogenase family protein [Alphaproteobacteria bacterium]|nr:prephenate/arogenate dehydrogenase family protein [Alphaproteobacteria bacterium]
MFKQVTIIGLGLIGSSLARVIGQHKLATKLIGADISLRVCEKALALGIVDEVTPQISDSVKNSDLVIICVPVGAYESVGQAIQGNLQEGAIITDVGSVKAEAIKALKPFLSSNIAFIPGHPIAGTEHSGPEAGFVELFTGRWTILTPVRQDEADIEKLRSFWEVAGAKVEVMTPEHHDMVLAITSHLPHLIAYTIVGTATSLETELQSEVIKYSASGFRDFTRIAASDPTMWRDIMLTNKEALLDILQRFSEDLSEMQKAIRRDKSEFLFDYFSKTRDIRRQVIAAGQAAQPQASSYAPEPQAGEQALESQSYQDQPGKAKQA